MQNLDIESFIMGGLTAVVLNALFNFIVVIALHCRGPRTTVNRTPIHIKKASMLFPFMIAGLLTGTAFAEALPEGVTAPPMIGWEEAPRQMFTLIGEMPNWACWSLLFAVAWFYGFTLRFIRRTAYSSGYAEGYADTSAVINEIGQDIHSRIKSDA